MTVTNLQTERLNKIRKDLQVAVGKNDISDNIFAGFIYEIISNNYVSEELLRDEFGLSKDAIQRWIIGKNLPQPDVRIIVLNWIVKSL